VHLSELAIGQKAIITAIPNDSILNLKLMSFGVFVGDKVEVTAKAPFGGPICLKHLNNSFFALRKSYAEKILIEFC
jgi:Fe2+ transport system protein FeoA